MVPPNINIVTFWQSFKDHLPTTEEKPLGYQKLNEIVNMMDE